MRCRYSLSLLPQQRPGGGIDRGINGRNCSRKFPVLVGVDFDRDASAECDMRNIGLGHLGLELDRVSPIIVAIVEAEVTYSPTAVDGY
jgi:hypothetical protein